MKYLLLILFFCGCSISNLNQKKTNNYPNNNQVSFVDADKNNDMVLDMDESIDLINSIENSNTYSPTYSFSLIILLVFIFTIFCIFLSNKKK